MTTAGLPALLFAALLVIAYASLVHIWTGHRLRDYIIYLIAAACGFLAGHLIGWLAQSPLPTLGQLHAIEASLLAWLALIGARAFTPDSQDSRSSAGG